MQRTLVAVLCGLMLAGGCTSDYEEGIFYTDPVRADGEFQETAPQPPSTIADVFQKTMKGRAPSGVAPAKDAEMRRFRFSVEVNVAAPAGTEVLDIWVPLPLECDGIQEVSNLLTAVNDNANKGEITIDEKHGNRMFHVRIPSPEESTLIEWSADIVRHIDAGQEEGTASEHHLAANTLVPIEGLATQRADKLGVLDDQKPVAARAKVIFDDVLDEMAYDKTVVGYGFGDLQRSMTVCKGNCTDFHARFIGVARAARIPVRFTMGIPLKVQAKGEYHSYHCWAHWHDGKNWRPVDISEADKIVRQDPFGAELYFRRLDVHRVALTTGRDVNLVPQQNQAPLNYFVFPYAEADGETVELNGENWTFRYEEM